MCGIVGGLSFTGDYLFDRVELNEASSFLRYRGPDDSGKVFIETTNTRVAFAHTRLSIIDISASGHQPMISYSGKTTIVFNGEIYNYQALKTDLLAKGYVFNTKSDTEVILNGFECWGIEPTLRKLDGMFALALFDKESESLFLARDPFGKKPLYYFVGDNKLAFSSDIRSFGKIRDIQLTLDLHSLGYFFAELSTPLESTIWEEVKKVKPGSYMKYDQSGVSAYKPYWKVRYTEDCNLGRKDIIENTEFLLGNAVKKRLVADVNVSALLSGGLDSSLGVAKMAEHSGGRVRTYSVGFKDANFNELPFAKQVAQRFNTEHTELIVDAKNFDDVNSLILEFGEPFADSSMIPTYLMSMEISKKEKVVLGGDGGDELFGGYHSYYFAHKFDKVKELTLFHPFAQGLHKIYPSYRTDFLNRLLSQTKLPSYSLLNRGLGFSEVELERLLPNPDFSKSLSREHKQVWEEHSQHSSNDLINVLSASLKTRLLNDYLVKIDRASMYASLEVRSPFLDKDLTEFAATLTPNQLFYKTGTKSILKAVAEKYFTQDFIHRKKMGFAVPVGDWFRDDLMLEMKEIILGGRQSLVNFNYEFIEELIHQHTDRLADHTHKLWSLYVFHVWANNQ